MFISELLGFFEFLEHCLFIFDRYFAFFFVTIYHAHAFVHSNLMPTQLISKTYNVLASYICDVFKDERDEGTNYNKYILAPYNDRYVRPYSILCLSFCHLLYTQSILYETYGFSWKKHWMLYVTKLMVGLGYLFDSSQRELLDRVKDLKVTVVFDMWIMNYNEVIFLIFTTIILILLIINLLAFQNLQEYSW